MGPFLAHAEGPPEGRRIALSGYDPISYFEAGTSYVYPPLGVLRRWDSFSQIEREIGDARVWAGIHYRTSVEHGARLGRQIGEFTIKTQMRPSTN